MADAATGGPLVSAAWLAGRLGAGTLRIVDGSWYLPAMGRNARGEFEAGHIPGAVFFDLEEVSDRTNPLPHMLPTARHFETAVGELGIAETDEVVIYDGAGIFSAPRIWWTFHVMGHERAYVLDGGLPAWRAAGGALETGPARPVPARYEARPRPGLVRAKAGILPELASGVQLWDGRPAGRFEGRDPEPRPGLASGHIPGSRSLPHTALLAADGRYLPPEELARAFAAAGADPSAPAITSCGSGVTAAVLALGAFHLTGRLPALYDGSWAEWGGDPAAPVETGPAR